MARTKKKPPPAPSTPNVIALDDFADEGEGEECCEGSTCELDDAEEPQPRRHASSVSNGNAAKLAAFHAGTMAQAMGTPEDAPPEMHADLLFHWQRGWRCTAAEANQGRGVAIATIYDPAERDILALRRTYMAWQPGCGPDRRDRRQDFPNALWTMTELIGTTWRNVHTGCQVMVDQVRADGFGNSHLCRGLSSVGHDGLYPHPRDSVGIWIYDRYVVEHWVRVDHWTPAEQLPWYALRIARSRDEIATRRAEAARIKANWHTTSCASINYNLCLKDIQREHACLRARLDEIHAVAAQHGLAVTPDLVNATAFRRQAPASTHQQSEQLSLF